MRVRCIFTDFLVCLSDTASDGPTPVGMAKLRHKQRHKRTHGPRYFPRYRSARFVEQFSGRAVSGAGWGAIAQKAPVSVCKPSALREA